MSLTKLQNPLLNPRRRLLLRRVTIPLLPFLFAFPVFQALGADPPLGEDPTMELSLQGEQEKALDELQKGFSLFPYDESIRKRLTAAYGAMGKRQLKRMQFDEAAENFENARKLSPDNQVYGIMKGIALYAGKKYDAAAVELEQARRNGGDNLTILLYLGHIYYDSGDLGKAIEEWDRALAMEPGNKPIRDKAAKARRELVVESRMDRGYSSMFVISYDEGTRSELADSVLDTMEAAYNRVGYDLSHYPVTRVPVILYTKRDYRSVTSGPEWSGGLYDGKVRLPIGGALEITPMLRGVLFHEYTHVVVGEITKGNCPTWLNEGLAEVEGRKEFTPPVAELETAAKTGEFIPFRALEGSLSSLDTRKALLAYQQSYSLVNFMITAYGMHKVREILVNLGSGMGSEAAIAGAFADYRLDFDGILQEWRTQLRKEYGSQ
jgi:tetratricopeptide (TPR) repeat protein